MELEFKDLNEEKGATGWCYKVYHKDGGLLCYVFTECFGNCQTFSVAWFEDIIESDVNVRQVIVKIAKKVEKPQFCIDVSSKVADEVRSIFSEDTILGNFEFTNNTGNEMELFLIKLNV